MQVLLALALVLLVLLDVLLRVRRMLWRVLLRALCPLLLPPLLLRVRALLRGWPDYCVSTAHRSAATPRTRHGS
jgi:hypothetical protein